MLQKEASEGQGHSMDGVVRNVSDDGFHVDDVSDARGSSRVSCSVTKAPILVCVTIVRLVTHGRHYCEQQHLIYVCT